MAMSRRDCCGTLAGGLAGLCVGWRAFADVVSPLRLWRAARARRFPGKVVPLSDDRPSEGRDLAG